MCRMSRYLFLRLATQPISSRDWDLLRLGLGKVWVPISAKVFPATWLGQGWWWLTLGEDGGLLALFVLLCMRFECDRTWVTLAILLLRLCIKDFALGPICLLLWLFVLKNDWWEGDLRPNVSPAALEFETIWLLDADLGMAPQLLPGGGGNNLDLQNPSEMMIRERSHNSVRIRQILKIDLCGSSSPITRTFRASEAVALWWFGGQFGHFFHVFWRNSIS